jgi:hypothetical protein
MKPLMDAITTGFPHPHFGDRINREMVRSEIEGGVLLSRLADGAELEIETQNRCYRLRNCGRGEALISGHPLFCPTPVRVKVHGSTWGGSILRAAFIGRGMRLEFSHPEYRTILTSMIVNIRDRGTRPDGPVNPS